MAIREAKYLIKISVDKISGFFVTYEQKVNQIEEKKEVVDKKKSLALKMSSH